ncbi:hypothetical protein, partial [Aminipila sp.]
ATRCNSAIIRCHSSSSCALKKALEYHCNGNCNECEMCNCDLS